MTFPRLSIVLASLTIAALGCTAEQGADEADDPSGGLQAPQREPSTSPTEDEAPKGAVDRDAGDGDGDGDAGDEDKGDAEPPEVTLAITDASFENASRTLGGAEVEYYFSFTLHNTSAVAVTAEDSLVFDFGGGKKVSVAIGHRCEPGSPPVKIEPGGSVKVTGMWLWIDSKGAVVVSRIPCLRTNSSFGGLHPGSAPVTTTFPGPITLELRGKTDDGTFRATGAASRAK
jgi:hypothetical protein